MADIRLTDDDRTVLGRATTDVDYAHIFLMPSGRLKADHNPDNPGIILATIDHKKVQRQTPLGEEVCKILEDMVERRPVVGLPVRLQRDVDRFPHFTAPKGLSGIVVDSHAKGTLLVQLDQPLLGAEEWDNCIIWDIGDDIAADLGLVL